ncbi:cytochrome b5-like [Pyrus ussuriensis x Pyrus communis]|uniref:Cytochrome b5-like n=1 Tax=Pyrus ussuriensis x Pyrus communis TaxID=2448454 RepID=A0A5N5F777_9ROSA|nr:LOW QUALITY PROTEIN: cytochrome b5 [Pyrus x bretschneideri]KAB2596960.1 cytochrome b5-like [Pyrus ussuriensis x Pyrus communis]KAB2614405.1 cytochrome b5-like [Pyrus ussuriensis x Pyrus communis]
MGSKSQLFHYDEVAKHNHKKDCWIIISGKVYDVTPFLEDHPGGDEVLLLAVEKDATDDFNDVGHSDSAREQMEKFYVGKVDTSTIPAQPNYKLPAQAAAQSEQSSGLLVKLLQFLLPLLIMGAAFALQYYNKK